METKFVDWLNDLKWLPVVEQQAGVEVELVDGGPGDSYYQKLDLSLTSGNIEDAVIATAAQANVYGGQGAFLDLAPLIEQYAPNIQKYLENDPTYRALVTNEDGTIYGLLAERPILSHVTFYRSDMYEAAGITPGSSLTIEQFTDQLRQLKDYYGPTIDNYFPLSGRDSFLKFLYAFNAQAGIDESGTIHGRAYDSGDTDASSDILAPGFLQMVEWYKTLLEEGLIDPEWLNGTATEDSWQQKMLTGQASVGDDFFTRPSWFMQNGGPENDPEYSMVVLPAFEDASGEQLKRDTQVYDLTRVFAISATSEKAESILKFLDTLYTAEGQTTMNFGVEGESYEVENGEPTYIVEFEKQGNEPVGTKVWNFLQDRLTFPVPVDNEAYYNWMDPLTKSYAEQYMTDYVLVQPTLKYSEEQLRQRTELQATVDPFVLAGITQFIEGDRPLSEWSDFLDEATDKGYNELTAIDQAAWDAMN